MRNPISRRGVLVSPGIVGLLVAPYAQATASVDPGVRLVPMPTRVFKTPDVGHERTESWVFWMFVETQTPAPLSIQSMRMELTKGGAPVRSADYGAAAVAALTIPPPMTPRLADGSASPKPIFWPKALRIRCTEPLASGVNAMEIELTLAHDGRPTLARRTIPVETYAQTTSLIFPFQARVW